MELAWENVLPFFGFPFASQNSDWDFCCLSFSWHLGQGARFSHPDSLQGWIPCDSQGWQWHCHRQAQGWAGLQWRCVIMIMIPDNNSNNNGIFIQQLPYGHRHFTVEEQQLYLGYTYIYIIQNSHMYARMCAHMYARACSTHTLLDEQKEWTVIREEIPTAELWEVWKEGRLKRLL